MSIGFLKKIKNVKKMNRGLESGLDDRIKSIFREMLNPKGGKGMGTKKELTKREKKDMAMKYEIAEELGLLEKVRESGWKGLTSRESGKIGGIMGRRKTEARARAAQHGEKACNPQEGKL